MQSLATEIKLFDQQKMQHSEQSRQRAALFLLAGIDLADVNINTPHERERLLSRLDRLIERERQRGTRQHWNYNLNRHISLKQLRDRLRKSQPHQTGNRNKFN